MIFLVHVKMCLRSFVIFLSRRLLLLFILKITKHGRRLFVKIFIYMTKCCNIIFNIIYCEVKVKES